MTKRLYHGTSKEAAEQINACGFVEAGQYFGGIYGVALSPRKEIAESYGEVIFTFDLDEENLVIDPESFDGDLSEGLEQGANVYYLGPLNI